MNPPLFRAFLVVWLQPAHRNFRRLYPIGRAQNSDIPTLQSITDGHANSLPVGKSEEFKIARVTVDKSPLRSLTGSCVNRVLPLTLTPLPHTQTSKVFQS